MFFLGLFEVFRTVFLLETFDSARGIDEFLLAGIERVAHRADFRVYFGRGAAGLEGISAAAMNDDFIVFRMYVLFHDKAPYL